MPDRKALCLVSGQLEEIGPADRLILPGDPLFGLHAVPKQYVDRVVPHIPDSGQSFFASGGVQSNSRFNSIDRVGVSGQLWISYVTAIADTPVSKLSMSSRGTAAAGTTLARLALFTVVAGDDSITKVAQTANDTTIGASTFNLAERILSTVGGFPSSYDLLAGTRYAIGYLQVATTACSLAGANILNSSTPPTQARIISGQTDIAASYAVANLPVHFYSAWLAARP